MGMSKLIKKNLKTDYDNPVFRLMLMDYLDTILSKNIYTEITVDGAVAQYSEGDFYGVLSHYRIPNKLWWFTLVLNGYKSPIDYRMEDVTIKIPDEAFISNLYAKHKASRTTVMLRNR